MPDENIAKISSHRIVVAGYYIARSPRSQDGDGSTRKRRVKYQEEFTITPRFHCESGPGALAHVLSEKRLHDRLAKKDPDFRGVGTHEVIEHENIAEAENVAENILE